MNLLARQGGGFVGEVAGQQVSVVGLVEPEGVLHDLGDVAELVADEAVTLGEGAVDVDLLHRERAVGVELGHVWVGAATGSPVSRAVRRVVGDVVEGEGGHGG